MKNQLVIFVLLSILLTACSPQVTATSEATVAPQSESTSATATPNAEEEFRASVIAQIQADPNYQSPYVQALEAVSGQSIPETCADFAVKLGTLENTFGINVYGKCYVWSEDEQFGYFQKLDEFGPLYFSPQGEGELRFKDLKSDHYAEMWHNGVMTLYIDGATGQWVKPGTEPTSVPPTPINNEQSTLVSQPEVIAQLVENYLKAPFPLNSLTSEQLSAFTHSFDSSRATFEQRQTFAIALVERYLSEPFDTSLLTPEQHAAFSMALAEKRNEEMGINFVSFTYLNGEEYYVNPQTLQPEKMPANPTDAFREQNSFEVYLPVQFDAQGNVMYLYKGEWRTVPNSAGFDFSMEITDPNDTRIELPKQAPITEGEYAGLTPLERLLVEKTYRFTIRPVVPLKDALGEIVFESGAAFSRESIFQIITFETDSQGKSTLAKVSLALPSGAFLLYKEGGEEMITSTSRIKDYGTFWKTLEENQIYYLAIANNPQVTIDYSSHISDDNIEGITLGHTESDDVSVVVGSTFIKRKID